MKVGVNVIIPESTWGHSLADRPRGYRYPVLWLQSGGGFDYTDWQRYTALELYASEAGVAVVCSGTYCSGYMDTYHGDFKYFSQLSIETPKVVRHLFPLSEKPEENFLAGFSMIDKQMAAGKKFPRAYMATGVEDAHYQDNVRFMQKYADQGIDAYRVIDHGYHNWEYCDRHVKQYLDWLVAEGKIKETFVRASE